MDYPHAKDEARSHGYSPGNGMSPMHLSAEPLASEEEADASIDPDAVDEREPAEPSLDFLRLETKPPTEGADPFVFDDIGDGLGSELSALSFGMGDGPRF